MTSVAPVGHDIGLMVADACAQACCEKVTRVAVVDALLSGTAVFERMRVDPRGLAVRLSRRSGYSEC
jgi:hypothetical protein